MLRRLATPPENIWFWLFTASAIAFSLKGATTESVLFCLAAWLDIRLPRYARVIVLPAPADGGTEQANG